MIKIGGQKETEAKMSQSQYARGWKFRNLKSERMMADIMMITFGHDIVTHRVDYLGDISFKVDHIYKRIYVENKIGD